MSEKDMLISFESEPYNFNKATKIYFGKNNSCRCGCNGTYAYKDKNPELFITYANEIMRLCAVILEINTIYINIPIGGNMAYTIYF